MVTISSRPVTAARAPKSVARLRCEERLLVQELDPQEGAHPLGERLLELDQCRARARAPEVRRPISCRYSARPSDARARLEARSCRRIATACATRELDVLLVQLRDLSARVLEVAAVVDHVVRSAQPRRAIGLRGDRSASASARGMPSRRIRRSSCSARDSRPPATRSTSCAEVGLDEQRYRDDRVRPVRARAARAVRARISGMQDALRASALAAASAKITFAHARRGRARRCDASTVGPNAAANAPSSAGCPGSTTSRATTSVSMSSRRAPRTASATIDLPLAMPPVRPTRSGACAQSAHGALRSSGCMPRGRARG